MKKTLLVTVFSLLFFSNAYSAPVDIPSRLKNVSPKENSDEKPFNMGISGGAEYLDARKLDVTGSTADNSLRGQFYGGKAFMSVDMLGSWDLYGTAAWAHDLRLRKAQINGQNVEVRFDDGLLWGAGANYMIYQFPEYYGLGVFVDGKYRRTEDLDYDQADIGNATDLAVTRIKKPKWEEWQGALGLAAKLNYFVPFAGVVYSDTRFNVDFLSGATEYRIDNAENDKTVGGFGGVSLVPNDVLSVDLQARFVDEASYEAKFNLKF